MKKHCTADSGTPSQSRGEPNLSPIANAMPRGPTLAVVQSMANMAVVDLECLLKPSQAAQVVNMAEKTLANDRVTHELGIPFIRIGSSVRYRPSDLREFIEARLVRPAVVKQ